MLYIAYTREDALFTVRIVEDLTSLGVDVWIDVNEIAPGADWDSAQRAAIEASEGLIVVLSPEAMKRDHMRREIQQAFDRGKAIYLAVAQRSPWRDWLNGLPVADFTESYEDGLDALLLNIAGDERSPAAPADEAEEWLRRATSADQTRQPGASEPRRSLLKRLLKR